MKETDYIQIDHLSKVYSQRDWQGRESRTQAVEDLSLTIRQGETLGLVGESGSGKSTLARLILGLEQPSSGEITYAQKLDPKTPGQQMQVIYQDPYSALNPRMTALEIVMEPLFHLPKEEARVKAQAMLLRVGIEGEQIHKRPAAFSGGQRQRIGIARAVVGRPDFIVCDEPTSALDVSIQAQILKLLKEVQEDYCLSYLFISHDLEVVKLVSDRIAVMYHGHLVELAPADELFANPQHAYTRYLLSAKLSLNPREASQQLQDLKLGTLQFEVTAEDEWVEVGPDHFVKRSSKGK